MPLLEEALADAALSTEERGAARERLGRAYALLGRFDDALRVLEQAREEAARAGDTRAGVRAAMLLANALIDHCDYPRAAAVLAGAREQARVLGDPVALAGLQWSQSRLYASQERQEIAVEYARMAHDTLAPTEHTTMAARALILLAHLENDRGNHEAALEHAEEAVAVVRPSGNRLDLGMAELERARVLSARGDGDEAAAIALGAVAGFVGSHPASAARAYAIAAQIFAEQRDTARAVELYELAVEVHPTRDRHLAEIYRALSAIYEERDELDRAMTYAKLALEIQQPGTA